MSQERLNHCMLLSIHIEKTWNKPKNIANVFCEAKKEDVPLVSFVIKTSLVKGLKCRYFQKNNLLRLMDNLFSGSKENTYLFF